VNFRFERRDPLRAAREKNSVSVMILDHFKMFNDNNGYEYRISW